MATGDAIPLFLCGDVMTGRGIDQLLDHPGSPELREDYITDARDYLELAEAAHTPGTIAIVSIHWGSNWGHPIPSEQLAFARRMIDGGVALVHGHSSHHPRALDLYRGRLILHGCGDFIDDYEGIGGYERYRSDLRLMFLPVLAEDGRLLRLRMIVLQSRKLRLRRASLEDTRWMAAHLDAVSRPFGVRILPGAAGEMEAIAPPRCG